MRKLALLLILLPVALVGCGCAGKSALLPGEVYVQQDRATLEAVKPYLDIAAQAQPDEAALIGAAGRAWEARVAAAERRYAAMKEPR